MTFRNKLVLFQISIIAVLAVILAVVQVLFFQDSYPRMERDLATKVQFCVKTLSATVDLGVLADDRALIKKSLERCRGSKDSADPDFVFAAVLDPVGKPLAAVGKLPGSFRPRELSGPIDVVRQSSSILAGGPLNFEGKPLGSVWAQYSTGTIDTTRRMFLLITVVGLIVVVASCLVSVFFIFRLVKPLNSMIRFVHRVARGQLSARLEVQAKDELATLADDLNRMTGRIQHRVVLGESLFHASRHFVSTDRVDLEEVLRNMGQALGADQAYVVRQAGKGGRLDVTDYWHLPGRESRPNMLQEPPASTFPWFLEVLKQTDHLLIPDVGALPADAHHDRHALLSGDMRAFLVVRIGPGLRNSPGFLVFCAARPSRCWDKEDIQAVQMIAEQLEIYWKRQEAEDELKHSEKRFRILFEYAPDPYYLNDLNGNFVDGNRAAEEMIGYSREELIGKNLLELNLLDDRELAEVAAALKKTTEEEAVELNEITLNRKDGGQVIVDIRAFPVKLGEQDLVLGIARDITARRQAEKERRALEERLRQFQKMEAVGQLAGGVAHEINNPLGVILGFAQSLCKQLDDDDPRSMPLRSIEREALRCKTLVADLLAFSRKSQDSLEIVEIDRLLESTSTLIKNPARVKSVDLEIDCPRSPSPVLADFNRLQQVLVNLSNNAIDAMPDGGSLAIRALPDNGWIRIEVSDTGIGIPPDVQDRIFEPFFTTKEVGKGTGLGLSLAYEIIQQHGGTLECQSEVGRGTTFIIQLPSGKNTIQALAS